MRVKSLLIFTLISLLLITGCNSDVSEGIFRQISKSETEVYVGKVDLLKIDGTDIYALTADGGLQKYQTTTKTWQRLDSGQGSVARALVTQVGGDVYYTHYPTGTPREHEWLKDDQITKGPKRFVLTTSAHGSWELAKANENTSEYFLYQNIADASVDTTSVLSTLFKYPPELLEGAADTVLLSGIKANASEYLYKLWTAGGWKTLTIGNSSEAVVAFSYKDSKTMIAITASGKVYQGSAVDYTLSDSGKHVTLLSYGSPEKPVPTFLVGDDLWMQGVTEFYQIDRTDGTLTKVSDKFAANLRSHTFKVTSWLFDDVNNVVYGGTAKNGIVKISDLNGDSVQWL